MVFSVITCLRADVRRYDKEIELRTYECIHGEFHSDHRAVVAIFKVKV